VLAWRENGRGVRRRLADRRGVSLNDLIAGALDPEVEKERGQV